MRNFQYKKIFTASIILGMFTFAAPAFAAQIQFVSSTQSLYEQQEFSVDVVLDPQAESINTVSADVVFPAGVTYIGTNDYKSIIGEWVDRPQILGDGHTVHFAGIIPGGFAGYIDPFNAKIQKPGFLIRIFLKTSGVGASDITAKNIHTYLNDGFGTETASFVAPLHLSVSSGVGVVQSQALDTTPPLDFVPIVMHNAALYDGKYIVTFSTQDADTGVDHYEVKEGASDWVRTSSPYIISDQTLSNQVFIKAVDRAGNTKIEEVPLPFQDHSGLGIVNLIAVIVVFALLCVIITWRRWLIKRYTI